LKKKMPSTSKFQPHIIERVYELLRDGHTRQSVCELLEIPTSTFNSWLVKGDTSLQKYAHYVEFKNNVVRCEKDATILLVDRIKDAAKKDWRAAAWILERTRDEYKANHNTSLEHKRMMDGLKIEAQRAEIRLTEAKIAALRGDGLSDGQILEILPIPELEDKGSGEASG
tara:strand:+ start:3860 stop:4369 length:510 start_codon:yes stop_codon:yes gene_type:complete